VITRKQQTLSRGKLKYEKSLHALRLAKRHVCKHSSVFLNVIDGENISGALTELYLRLCFQRPYISPPKELGVAGREKEEEGETLRMFVYSEKDQAHITESLGVTYVI